MHVAKALSSIFYTTYSLGVCNRAVVRYGAEHMLQGSGAQQGSGAHVHSCVPVTFVHVTMKVTQWAACPDAPYQCSPAHECLMRQG